MTIDDDRYDPDSWPLGKVSDAKIAAREGVTRYHVMLERRARGIEPFRAIAWPSEDFPIGYVRDSDVAKVAEVSVPQVRRARLSRGIPGASTGWCSDSLREAAMLRWLLDAEEKNGRAYALKCAAIWGVQW